MLTLKKFTEKLINDYGTCPICGESEEILPLYCPTQQKLMTSEFYKDMNEKHGLAFLCNGCGSFGFMPWEEI